MSRRNQVNFLSVCLNVRIHKYSCCISNTVHIIFFLFFTEARIQWSIDPDQSSLDLWMMLVVMNQARDVNSSSFTSFNQLKLQSRLVSRGHHPLINQSKVYFNTESLSLKKCSPIEPCITTVINTRSTWSPVGFLRTTNTAFFEPH